MVVQQAAALPKNGFGQYKRSSFSSQPGFLQTPNRLKKVTPPKIRGSNSVRSYRTAESRENVEAYDPFGNEQREDIEDSRSLFSQESSKKLWPEMPSSTSQQNDTEYLPETGPTGTPKRNKTGSTPFKSTMPIEDDKDGFDDGFRILFSSSTSDRHSKTSISNNFVDNESKKNTQSFEKFCAEPVKKTPKGFPKSSVFIKYKSNESETRNDFRASHSASIIPKRFSQSSTFSKVSANDNEESTNSFRSSFSAFTSQRVAKSSLSSVNTADQSEASASQRSVKSASSKFSANMSQAGDKPKPLYTPQRSKRSSVSSKYLSAVASNGQVSLTPSKDEVNVKKEPEKVELSTKVAEAAVSESVLSPTNERKKPMNSHNIISTEKAENEIEKIIEVRVAMELSKMKAQFDEEVQRIEELVERTYSQRIEELEKKTDKMNKILGKMISKRKSIDRLEV